MTNQPQPEVSPAVSTFQQHLAAFHASLPVEEQALLEQLVGLAATACTSDVEVTGYSVISSTTQNVLGPASAISITRQSNFQGLTNLLSTGALTLTFGSKGSGAG